MIKEATAALIDGKDLTYEQANAVINEIMNGKKVGTLFLSKEHARDAENEIAPELPQYRRAAKKLKKVKN